MADKVTIEVHDAAIRQLLDKIIQKAGHPGPKLETIGESQVERIKLRFKTSTGPDGTPWAPNRPVTVARFVHSVGGTKTADGKLLSKKGEKRWDSKKPLIGETKSLSTQIRYEVLFSEGGQAGLVIGSLMEYAAMQQFGGKKADYAHLWGDIPARPYMPVKSDGTLYDEDRREIEQELTDYYADLFG